MSFGFYGNAPLNVSLSNPRQPQAIATATRSLSAGGTTSLLNTSNAGFLMGIWIEVSGTPSGTPDAEIQINIDGGGAVTLLGLYDGTANTWEDAAQRFRRWESGDGDADGDLIFIPLGVAFASSCAVDLVCGSAGSAGSILGAALYAEDV